MDSSEPFNFLDLIDDVRDLVVRRHLDPATRCSLSLTAKALHEKYFDLNMFGIQFPIECVRYGHIRLFRFALTELGCPLELLEVLNATSDFPELQTIETFRCLHRLLENEYHVIPSRISRCDYSFHHGVANFVHSLPVSQLHSVLADPCWGEILSPPVYDKKVRHRHHKIEIIMKLGFLEAIDFFRFLFEQRRTQSRGQFSPWFALLKKVNLFLIGIRTTNLDFLFSLMKWFKGKSEEETTNDIMNHVAEYITVVGEVNIFGLTDFKRPSCLPNFKFFMEHQFANPEAFNRFELRQILFYEWLRHKDLDAIKYLLSCRQNFGWSHEKYLNVIETIFQSAIEHLLCAAAFRELKSFFDLIPISRQCEIVNDTFPFTPKSGEFCEAVLFIFENYHQEVRKAIIERMIDEDFDFSDIIRSGSVVFFKEMVPILGNSVNFGHHIVEYCMESFDDGDFNLEKSRPVVEFLLHNGVTLPSGPGDWGCHAENMTIDLSVFILKKDAMEHYQFFWNLFDVKLFNDHFVSIHFFKRFIDRISDRDRIRAHRRLSDTLSCLRFILEKSAVGWKPEFNLIVDQVENEKFRDEIMKFAATFNSNISNHFDL